MIGLLSARKGVRQGTKGRKSREFQNVRIFNKYLMDSGSEDKHRADLNTSESTRDGEKITLIMMMIERCTAAAATPLGPEFNRFMIRT